MKRRTVLPGVHMRVNLEIDVGLLRGGLPEPAP